MCKILYYRSPLIISISTGVSSGRRGLVYYRGTRPTPRDARGTDTPHGCGARAFAFATRVRTAPPAGIRAHYCANVRTRSAMVSGGDAQLFRPDTHAHTIGDNYCTGITLFIGEIVARYDARNGGDGDNINKKCRNSSGFHTTVGDNDY